MSAKHSHSRAKTVERKSRTGLILIRLAAILGLSTLLGFSFNTSNPIGVRLSNPPAPVQVAAAPGERAALPPVVAPSPSAPAPASAASPAAAPVTFPTHPHTAVTNPPVDNASSMTTSAPAVPATDAPPNPAPIHWVEAKPLIARGEAVLIDVRPRPVYDAGHIPGAISFPESSLPDEFTAFHQKYPRDKLLIFYCSSTSCSMSERVAKRMVAQFSYTSVKYMTGGYLEWQQLEQAQPQPAVTP